MEINEKRAAAIFKAFCDENRIRILKQLRTGEKSWPAKRENGWR